MGPGDSTKTGYRSALYPKRPRFSLFPFASPLTVQVIDAVQFREVHSSHLHVSPAASSEEKIATVGASGRSAPSNYVQYVGNEMK